VNAPIFAALPLSWPASAQRSRGRRSWTTVRERFALPILAGVAAVVAAWALAVRGPAPLAIFGWPPSSWS